MVLNLSSIEPHGVRLVSFSALAGLVHPIRMTRVKCVLCWRSSLDTVAFSANKASY